MGIILLKLPTKKHFFTLLSTLIEATNAVKQNYTKNANLFNEVKDLAAVVKSSN
jgi:hypothetical protein